MLQYECKLFIQNLFECVSAGFIPITLFFETNCDMQNLSSAIFCLQEQIKLLELSVYNMNAL